MLSTALYSLRYAYICLSPFFFVLLCGCPNQSLFMRAACSILIGKEVLLFPFNLIVICEIFLVVFYWALIPLTSPTHAVYLS